MSTNIEDVLGIRDMIRYMGLSLRISRILYNNAGVVIVSCNVQVVLKKESLL